MIVYRFITLRQIADDVILRARPFINAENFDWDTLVLFINRAMQEVLTRTLPYKDWAYLDTIAVTHRMTLPREYIKFVRVLVSSAGRAPFLEARYVDAKEWYATTNWQRQQEWNKASIINPIFTLWGYVVNFAVAAQNDAQVTIQIAPNTDFQTGTAPAGTNYYAGPNYSGIMEFYRMPQLITADNALLPIPPEFEELMVLSTLVRLLAKVGSVDRLPELQKMILLERSRITDRFMEKQRTADKELDSFVEPVPPIINMPPQTGEVPANLGGNQ